jgi:sugar phosphate isomerase/epimerase
MEPTRRAFLKRSFALLGGAGLGWEGFERLALGATGTPTKYQLSCQTLPYRAFPLQRALQGISKAGYKYAMLYQTHAGQPVFTPALSASDRSALKKLLEDHGLAVHMSFIGLGVNVATEKGRSDYKKELDLFREFEIKTVVGIGPWGYKKFPDEPKSGPEWERECALFYEGLEQVVPHAEQLGVTISLKPHTGITATAKACLQVVKRIVSENLKICWDAGNVSFYEGIHPDPDLPELASHVRAVCIKDHRGGRAHADFPVPGQGDVNHDLMFKILFGAGFRGPLSVERVDGTMEATKMDAEMIDQRIKEAYTFLRPLLEKHAGR